MRFKYIARVCMGWGMERRESDRPYHQLEEMLGFLVAGFTATEIF